ncbi:MAG: hypothetical protein Q8764_01115 [Pigeon pea little leaf phytoplasma]|uniref:MnmE helical domain-containing protein n=1 Tax=Candidatus Phytoplasma fabacearum TaxID=2982628 RepID=A0ABU8ZSF3_9MOLU|nr:hypothetical protein ['Bituminaria bituminosa' little leaf phytoplasma]MDV3158173.1 hypothetical protein [Pigeon pea little leaf phytoplasma]MDO8023738.1 hypothetical protein ['Bituminaria bituminosa' little leaf phytoplasma]MDV3158610.1 hypothetical protein [Pigeon pea little leaf phytoplasma]MDV3161480.1 hypothetical protein [Pigeon pea little leaf phytoplasma]MDV3196705.1 hypothetical protein [Pigeon pea little leaf phytoplasma]
MESRMLGNLLVRFGWGLFVIVNRKTNPINKTQIIYPYSQIIFISNHTQEGIENLKQKIIKRFNLQDIQERNFDYLFNLRQVNQLKKAIISLKNVLTDIKRNMPIDIHVIHFKEAYQSLENILGSNLQKNLINELFSKFCLGK